MTDKEKAFLEDYGELCLQYGLFIGMFGDEPSYLAIENTTRINLPEYLNQIAKESD